MRIAVAQLGARGHYTVPRIFHEAGMLERLFTDNYVGNKPWLEAGLGSIPSRFRPRAVDRWLGRKDPVLPPRKVTSFESLGFAFSRARRRADPGPEMLDVFHSYSERFQRAVLKYGLGAADAVYVMPGSSHLLAGVARERGLTSIYEQFDHTHRYALRLLREELEAVGGPRTALLSQSDLDTRYVDFENMSIANADSIIVASDYTRRSMIADGYDVDNVRIVPYGVDLSRWQAASDCKTRQPGRLRVLYVGSVDLRKGVIYLLQAARRIGFDKIDLKIAGSIGLPEQLMRDYGCSEYLLGAVPRTKVSKLFNWADILVFPTLGEGFGFVQIEAIACGTPVIATSACGEVVREGIEGHIVQPRDAEAIAGWLDYYAADPARLEPLREAAFARARFFSLEAYAARLVAAVAAKGWQSLAAKKSQLHSVEATTTRCAE